MKQVILASTEPKTRLVRIYHSLRKKYEVSILDPVVKAPAIKWLGRVPSAVLRWPAYSLQAFASNSDILHLDDSPIFVAIPMLYKKCKFVFDYRTSFTEKLETEFPQSSLVNAAWRVETKLMRRADVILTVNDILAERIKHRYGRRAYVVPNYPPKHFLPVRNKWEIRCDTTKPIVLFLGLFSRLIDFENLLKCARKMPECEFWLIGDGPLKGWVQRYASSNIKLLGYIPHEEIADYINACDVGIVPIKPITKSVISNDQDVTKVGELAALQKPIVASGVAPSSQYLLVKPDEMAKGIEEALSGNVPTPVPRRWEDYSEKILFEAYDLFK